MESFQSAQDTKGFLSHRGDSRQNLNTSKTELKIQMAHHRK